MRSKKVVFVVGLVLVVVALATAFPTITNRSEKEIVTRSLNLALVKQELPDYKILKKRNPIILSTENIAPDLIPNLPGVNLTILSPAEIQNKADAEGDYLYLRFTQLRIGTLMSTVSLDNVWVRSKDSKTFYLSGGGLKLRYYNLFGFWIQSPYIGRWIS